MDSVSSLLLGIMIGWVSLLVFFLCLPDKPEDRNRGRW